MPLYKFQSNEGWWVSPEECTIIAAGLEVALEIGGDTIFPKGDVSSVLTEQMGKVLGVSGGASPMPADEALESIRDWIRFNRNAVRLGGYEVF